MTKNNLIVAFEQGSLKCCNERCEECNYAYCVSTCAKKYFKELKQYCTEDNLSAGFEYSLKGNVISIQKYNW